MAVLETVLTHPFLLALAALWCSLWVYCYVTCGYCKSKARLDGKTVIITGCTSGIGEATAIDLAKRGARLIMACRNLQKANEVRKHIVEATGNENVMVKFLDVGLLSSVRKFAEEINSTENRLDILIHNAGTGLHEDFTDEGFNVVWATNHFGPFLLTNLLIDDGRPWVRIYPPEPEVNLTTEFVATNPDLLKKTKKSRIVILSSAMHFFGDVDLENPNPKNGTFPITYASSKFASMLVANELARRLKNSEVTVNSLHPGLIETAITQHGSKIWPWIVKLSRPMLKTVEQGAQTTIYLAVSDEVEGVTGKYFADCKEVYSAQKTRDVELAKKYWALCEEIVELNSSDTKKSRL